jgi:hypothetical protein
MRFFYQGQFGGRTDQLPVQIGRWRNEPSDGELGRFYDRLLAAVNDDIYHAGEWRLLEVSPAGDRSNDDVLAWQWNRDDEVRIVTINLGEAAAHGLVRLASALPGDGGTDTVILEDELDGYQYPWSRQAVDQHGLYVKLAAGGAHLLRVAR